MHSANKKQGVLLTRFFTRNSSNIPKVNNDINTKCIVNKVIIEPMEKRRLPKKKKNIKPRIIDATIKKHSCRKVVTFLKIKLKKIQKANKRQGINMELSSDLNCLNNKKYVPI